MVCNNNVMGKKYMTCNDLAEYLNKAINLHPEIKDLPVELVLNDYNDIGVVFEQLYKGRLCDVTLDENMLTFEKIVALQGEVTYINDFDEDLDEDDDDE